MRSSSDSDSSSSESETSASNVRKLKSLNISDDHHYTPKLTSTARNFVCSPELVEIPRYGSQTIIHSLPAYDLWRPFFPTYLSDDKFRDFHRPKLRHYKIGPQAPGPRNKLRHFPVKNLTRTIYRYQKKLRHKVINAINAGWSRQEIIEKMLLIRRAVDLTAKQGDLFLFEYCEEHPPVLSQVGMSANIKTFFRPQSTLTSKIQAKKNPTPSDPLKNPPSSQEKQEESSANPKTPTTCNPIAHSSSKIGIDVTLSNDNDAKLVYYNRLKPGARLQTIENNMYRAPIFEHDMSSCDFLVIRTRNSFYIRPVSGLYIVGQTMPLATVPQPIPSSIHKFRFDFSNKHIHRMFMDHSDPNNPCIRFTHLLKLFPDYHRSALSKRFLQKGCVRKADRDDCLYYRGQSKFGLFSLREQRAMFTPEQYCLNMAMLAARERLRELNYTESMICPPEEVELETEIMAAPWNTTKAVIGALGCRNYLDLKRHLIDPTGISREGFSCVAWSRSPTEDQQAKQMKSGRNIPASKTTQPVFGKNPFLIKIRQEKLNRLNVFIDEAHMIAELQRSSLSCKDALSSGEEDDEEIDEDNEDKLADASFDQQLQDLDRLVLGARSINQLNYEKEEEERAQMMREFNLDKSAKKDTVPEVPRASQESTTRVETGDFKGRVLRIVRTYDSPDGKIQRTEIVREPKIIAMYVKQKGPNVEAPQTARRSAPSDAIEQSSRNQMTPDALGTPNNRSRRRSAPLGPTELCRSDGTKVTISMSVLKKAARASKKNLRPPSRLDYSDQM